MDAKQIASEAYQWFGNAVGDMAYDNVDWDGKPKEWCSEEIKKKLKQAEKDGVTDLAGWLADEFYNDPDQLCMVADHIGDMSCTHSVSKYEIWVEFRKLIHSRLHEKCDEYIDRYELEEDATVYKKCQNCNNGVEENKWQEQKGLCTACIEAIN